MQWYQGQLQGWNTYAGSVVSQWELQRCRTRRNRLPIRIRDDDRRERHP